MRFTVCLVAVLLLLCDRTFAQQPGLAGCLDLAKTQLDINACAASDWAAADKELNETYRALLKRLTDGKDQQALKAAQLAWISFRDKDCTYQAGPEEDGGSARPMVYEGCVASLTRDRTKQLKGFLNCEEGDLSCRVSH